MGTSSVFIRPLADVSLNTEDVPIGDEMKHSATKIHAILAITHMYMIPEITV